MPLRNANRTVKQWQFLMFSVVMNFEQISKVRINKMWSILSRSVEANDTVVFVVVAVYYGRAKFTAKCHQANHLEQNLDRVLPKKNKCLARKFIGLLIQEGKASDSSTSDITTKFHTNGQLDCAKSKKLKRSQARLLQYWCYSSKLKNSRGWMNKFEIKTDGKIYERKSKQLYCYLLFWSAGGGWQRNTWTNAGVTHLKLSYR